MAELTYSIDWQRRRLLPTKEAHMGADPAQTHCVHGSRLIEWCPNCSADLDAIMLDFRVQRAAS